MATQAANKAWERGWAGPNAAIRKGDPPTVGDYCLL